MRDPQEAQGLGVGTGGGAGGLEQSDLLSAPVTEDGDKRKEEDI